jgi:hypothetical protein
MMLDVDHKPINNLNKLDKPFLHQVTPNYDNYRTDTEDKISQNRQNHTFYTYLSLSHPQGSFT